MPFCLMWANENWTRRWDGSDEQVLVSQDYRLRDEPALIAEFARHFADARYIRLNGRPVLMVYRGRLIPDAAATVDRWRHLFRDGFGEDPVFVMAQSFGDTDPLACGMDAAVEFPPHKLTSRTPMINDSLHVLDPAFTAEVYDYAAIAEASATEPAPAYPLIKTAVPGWDNDPRRQGAGTVLHGATPALYQAWLEDLIRFARRHPVEGETLVCINAWNEWAEGATLEPDVHWGGAFLNATARAVAGLPAPGERTCILLVGHDGLRHGAQTLLLRIGQALQRRHGVSVAFLLLAGGPMEADYRAVAPTTVVSDGNTLEAFARSARVSGCGAALVNSAASAGAVAVLQRHGIPAVLLVHELPRLLREKGLTVPLRDALAAAGAVVFPAGLVRDRCVEAVGPVGGRCAILPQGIEPAPALDEQQREAARAALHLPPGSMLALGMGYADIRKGFDLFLQVWRVARAAGQPVHFAWAGGIDPATEAYLGTEIAMAEATGTFRFLGHRDDARALLGAADVFVLTSREDPLPSVALEALAAGTPVVAFDETGGLPELLARTSGGCSVPLGDTAAMAQAALHAAGGSTPERRAALAGASQEAFRFDRYSAALLAVARPRLLPVSVVVPSCDYGRFMAARLASVFAQTHPVTEVVLLDDASSDDSVAVAEATAAGWGRHLRVERQVRRSGSVWAQWRRAADTAAGEWLWIAEADDCAEPGFLSALAEAVGRAPGAVFAFTDSRAIDEEGATLWADHKAYYAGALQTDAVFEGRDFLRQHLAERNLILNASAVLWRRADLLAALRRCEGELQALRVAGDWRIYAEMLARAGARIAYVAQPLNQHRRHGASATAKQETATHVAEIARVHAAVARLIGPAPGLVRRQRTYRQTLSTSSDRSGAS